MALPEQFADSVWSLLNAGREAEALRTLADRLKARPADPVANKLMALILGGRGDDAAAALHLQRAAISDPKDPELRRLLGNVLANLGRHKEAAGAYREFIRLAPTSPEGYAGLATSLLATDRQDEGVEVLRRGMASAPRDARAVLNLCLVLMELGRMEEAGRTALEGVRACGEVAGLLEVAAFASNFYPGPAATDVRSLHERLGAAYAAASRRAAPSFTNDRDPARPLRVGFLSGDFGHHVCAAFMKPALLNFDPGKVVPHCYSTQPDDGGEGPFKERCRWRSVVGLDDASLAAAIASDQIDILVECSGLTPGHRLPALIPRVAPIQCTWLGYPNTTGLPTMDYRIVDAQTDPPGTEAHCTEALARLPRCFLCYTPSPWAGEVSLSPATLSDTSREPVVFGSFNRITKICEATIDAWCGVLRAVPDSRMLIKLRTRSAGQRGAAVARFESRGVEASRIDIAEWTADAAEHARMYARMDIALDSFPYNGTTTTCEAMWMGVPVVVIAGDSHRARVGASLLHSVGLDDLIASDADGFVRIAAGLAADRPRLRSLRLGLRDLVASSPLRDAAGYARAFEACLREMWLRWCAARNA